MRVFYVHWNEGECKARAKAIRAAGHTVRSHWSATEHAALKDPLPEVLVISLDRLPSHGRQIAEWLWEAKKRQHIPIVFEGGVPEKVATTKEKFPRALFCASGHIADVLRRLQSDGNTARPPATSR